MRRNDSPQQRPLLERPTGKPVGILQKHGYHGSMSDFNQRVQTVHDAHLNALGYRPSRALVFDVARSAVRDADLSHLFDVRTKRQSRSRGAAMGALAGNMEPSEPEAAGFLGDLGDAIGGSTVAKAAGFVWKGNKQVVTALKDSPAGVWQTANAVNKDVNDLLWQGDNTPERTGAIVGATAAQVKRDFTHPGDYPGFLALDILGFGTAGAGFTARMAAASRATGAVGKAKALAKKPPPQTLTVGKPGATEEVLLSENALVRAAQRGVIGRRQRKFDERTDDGNPVPASALAPGSSGSVRRFVQKNFSFEAKLGREAAARQRAEEVLALLPKQELERVTGWAVAAKPAFARLPVKVRKGLTVGEQKAIFSLALDDANPIAAQRSFHARMIEKGVGDPDAHRAQLLALNEAEKVLSNPAKQSPRFQKALELTQWAVAEMERLKIDELGLSPITAESRVAALGDVVRTGELVESGPKPKRVGGSFYVPTVSAAKTKKAPRFPFLGVRVGPFGIPKQRPLPELSHEFTGGAIRAGDIRVDTTNLVAEAYGRTVRKAALANDYQRLRAFATKTPKSEYDVPIRDTAKIPERLRAIMADVDAGEIGDLSAADHRTLLNTLYPGEWDAGARKWRAKAGENLDGVSWVDSRLIHDYDKVPQVPGPVTKAAQAINEPFRVATLFLRPAYALNIVSNTGALILHDFGRNIPNFVRSFGMEKRYGAKTSLGIKQAMGSGKSRSFVDDTLTGKGTLAGRKLAEVWNKVADEKFRDTAFITEAQKLGYDTKGKPMSDLFKPANSADFTAVKRRANKAMIEFDNLTWYEKNYLRHAIFVYPFISRGTVWSLRTILEHPLKVGMLAHLGEGADKDPALEQAPEWIKQRGFVPVGWTADGKPKVIDANSVNTFALLSEMLYSGEAQVTEDRFNALGQMFGPAATFATHWASGKDDFGNDYPGGDFFGAAGEVLGGLPQVSARKRAGQEQPPLRPTDITDRGSLAARERSALERTVLSPGWLDGYGMLITGGLTPRELDPMAASARYWKDMPLKERHKHEQQLVRKALRMQSEFLARPLPAGVKDAVDFAGKLDLRMKRFTEDNARTPTPKERTLLLVDELGDRIPEKRLALVQKHLKGKRTESEWKKFRAVLMDEYANAEALQDWDADVRLVASFRKPILEKKLQVLKAAGLVSSARVDGSPEALREYGRKYLAYAEKMRTLRGQAYDLLDKEGRSLAYAEMRRLEQTNDKPVTVGDKTFPSLPRMAWAHLTPRSQREALASAAGRWGWGTTSPLMKEMLGHKQPKDVANGWVEFERLKDEVRQQQPQGERTFPPGYELELAKYVNRYAAPGFYKDWLFSKQPLARRLQQFKVVQKSKNRAEWDALLGVAAPYASALARPDTDKGAARDAWHDYVDSSLIPWVESNPKFRKELSDFGPSLLYRLIDA
jgi:hypothetical protein